MIQIIIYAIIVCWLIHHIIKEVKQCPYCKKYMKYKRSKFGVMWECNCGCQIWEVK